MTIDWNTFTPWHALAGGIAIGLASAMFVLLNGRIAGISGVIASVLKPSNGDMVVPVAFLLGLVVAPIVYSLFWVLPAIQIDAGYGSLVCAGLLVGIGTRYGGGCTSGHGVCGLSRLSLRSLVASAVFMGVAMATVFVVRHVLARY